MDLFPLALFPHCPLKRLLLSREPQRLVVLFSLSFSLSVQSLLLTSLFLFHILCPSASFILFYFISLRTHFSSLLPLSRKYTIFDRSCYSTCFPHLRSSITLVPVHPGIFTLYILLIYLYCRPLKLLAPTPLLLLFYIYRITESLLSATNFKMVGPRGGPSRKSHTKSRNGCKTCKRRHIRCDESFPQWYGSVTS